MSTDDKVKVLEDEFKLIKSELRQTLTSFRDFMLDLKFPPIQEDANPLAKKMQSTMGGGSASSPAPAQQTQRTAVDERSPNQMTHSENKDSQEYGEMEPGIARVMETPQNRMNVISNGIPKVKTHPVDDRPLSEMEVPPDIEDTGITSGDIPMEQEPEIKGSSVEEISDMRIDESRSSIPQVNLMANLIRWVSVARKEIGTDQLPVFLDVYATAGNLSQEMRDVILHLVEVAADPVHEAGTIDRSRLINEQITACMELNSLAGQLPTELKEKIQHLTELSFKQSLSSKADIWSQLLLELHGIITGGGISHYSIPLVYHKETSEDKAVEERVEESKVELDENKMEESSVETVQPAEIPEKSKDNSQILNNIKPARLRLVFPVGDGTEQELDLGSLSVATNSKSKEGNGHENLSVT